MHITTLKMITHIVAIKKTLQHFGHIIDMQLKVLSINLDQILITLNSLIHYRKINK